jgi:hypothetical protein
MSTDWNEFAKNNFVKLAAILVLILITSIVLWIIY